MEHTGTNSMKDDDDTQVYRSEMEAAVKAERQAVLDTIDELYNMEVHRHPMFSDGHNHALTHIEEFIKGREARSEGRLFDDWDGGFPYGEEKK